MVKIKQIVLDVLKPHYPNGLEFAVAVAGGCPAAQVKLSVVEVDEKTETVTMVVSGVDLDYDAIARIIAELGGTVHSIDEVEVANAPGTAGPDSE